MKLIKMALLAGVILMVCLGAGQPQISQPEEKLRWYTIEEVAKIKQENPEDDKAIFIDVYTDWCGWCKRMDATTFSDEAVKSILTEEFYPVKFDAEQKETIVLQDKTFKFINAGRRGYHELAATLLQGKMSYPTVVFLDADFNMIQPLPGYRGAKEILPILHFIGKEAYKEQTWTSFAEDWQKEKG